MSGLHCTGNFDSCKGICPGGRWGEGCGRGVTIVLLAFEAAKVH